MMNPRLLELSAEMTKQAPAPAAALQALVSSAWVPVPADYLEFLAHSNGAEGSVGESYLELWRVEDVLRLNSEYRVRDFLPAVMLFGTSLGGSGYGFSEGGRLVEVPFDSLDAADIVARGDTLVDLFEMLATQWAAA